MMHTALLLPVRASKRRDSTTGGVHRLEYNVFPSLFKLLGFRSSLVSFL